MAGMGRGLFSFHFRTLDDGTVLYRKNRTTPTYLITNEQHDQISRLQLKEVAVGLLLVLPVLSFLKNSWDGDFGRVWQIKGAYTFAYCIFMFFLVRLNSSRIDNILQRAKLALPEQEIIFPGIMEGYRKLFANFSIIKKIYLCFFCFVFIGFSIFMFGSAVWNFMFWGYLEPEAVKYLVLSAFLLLISVPPIVVALYDMLEKRAGKKNV